MTRYGNIHMRLSNYPLNPRFHVSLTLAHVWALLIIVSYKNYYLSIMQDEFWHKGLRKKLVAAIKAKGITNINVLHAIHALPRHYFFEKAFAETAYEDKAFPIGNDQTISQPYTVAYQSQLLDIKKRDKVLEIGTGSGYQAAILALLGARVYTIERQQGLYKKAKKLLTSIGLQRIRCYHKDGYKGLAEFAPFDKIIVTAGAEQTPKALLDQLKVGGCLVIPVGKGTQTMMRITKESDTSYKTEKFDKFKFVPFLNGLAKG